MCPAACAKVRYRHSLWPSRLHYIRALATGVGYAKLLVQVRPTAAGEAERKATLRGVTVRCKLNQHVSTSARPNLWRIQFSMQVTA